MTNERLTITIFVKLPHFDEQVCRELELPDTLEQLKQQLDVSQAQELLCSHPRFPDEYSLVENPRQLFDGCRIKMVVPKRRVFVSTALMNNIVNGEESLSSSRPVSWFPGAAVEDIEKGILSTALELARTNGVAVEFPQNFSIKDLNTGDNLAISTSLPQDTKLVVRFVQEFAQPVQQPVQKEVLVSREKEAGVVGPQGQKKYLATTSASNYRSQTRDEVSNRSSSAQRSSVAATSSVGGRECGARNSDIIDRMPQGRRSSDHDADQAIKLQPGQSPMIYYPNEGAVAVDAYGNPIDANGGPGKNPLLRTREQFAVSTTTGGGGRPNTTPVQTTSSKTRGGSEYRNQTPVRLSNNNVLTYSDLGPGGNAGYDGSPMLPPGTQMSRSGMRRLNSNSAQARRKQPGSAPRKLPIPGQSTSKVASLRSGAHPLKATGPDECCVHMLQGHHGFVYSMCAVGDVLFTGSQDLNIIIWDLNTLQYIGTLPGHKGFVRCMDADLESKILISGSHDKTLRAWSLETFSTVKVFTGHKEEIHCCKIIPIVGAAKQVFVSGGEDKTLRVWSIIHGEQLLVIEQAHTSAIFTLTMLTPSMLLTGGRDRTMKVWSLESRWELVKTLFPPHYDSVTAVAVSGELQRLYSVSRDRCLKAWDINSFENVLQQLHIHNDWVTDVVITNSNAENSVLGVQQFLVTASKDCSIKIWNPLSLQCLEAFLGHRGPVNSLLVVNDCLFSASHDRTVRVWKNGDYFFESQEDVIDEGLQQDLEGDDYAFQFYKEKDVDGGQNGNQSGGQNGTGDNLPQDQGDVGVEMNPRSGEDGLLVVDGVDQQVEGAYQEVQEGHGGEYEV